MPPYQQTYEETFEIEEDTLERDVNILNQISRYRYDFQPVDILSLQYEGADFIGVLRDDALNPEEVIYVDRKTSKKKKREWFHFELYYKNENGTKKESWSLKAPYRDLEKFLIAFMDENQVVTMSKKNMIEIVKELEKERPDLIKVKVEKNKKGKNVDKYLIRLNKAHRNFKRMKPRIYEIDDKNEFVLTEDYSKY
jgi:hypothetical protein